MGWTIRMTHCLVTQFQLCNKNKSQYHNTLKHSLPLPIVLILQIKGMRNMKSWVQLENKPFSFPVPAECSTAGSNMCIRDREALAGHGGYLPCSRPHWTDQDAEYWAEQGTIWPPHRPLWCPHCHGCAQEVSQGITRSSSSCWLVVVYSYAICCVWIEEVYTTCAVYLYNIIIILFPTHFVMSRLLLCQPCV